MLPDMFQNSPLIHKGERLDIHTVNLPGSTKDAPIKRELIVHPGAVVILPMIDERHVVMIRNERYAVGETLWELPAGTLEPQEESIESCASRELVEETGYRSRSITKLIEFYSAPGFCTELLHVFVAKDLEHVGQELDECERITVEVTPIEQVVEMIQDNRIRDAKTIATILYYQTFTGNND